MAGVLNSFDLNRFISSTGGITSATVYFYYTNSTILAPIYTDITLTSASANPYTIPAGSLVPTVFLDPSVTYRRRVVFADGTIYESDPIDVGTEGLRLLLASTGTSKGAAAVGYSNTAAGAVARTVQAKLQNIVTPEDFDAVGDGTTDDYTAFVKAAAAALAAKVPLVLSDKTYVIAQDTLALPSITWQNNGAVLKFTKDMIPVAAGGFVVGRIYRIATAGTTDFTLIGAANNTVGTTFTATGAGSGNGTAYYLIPALSVSTGFIADAISVSIPSGISRQYGIIATGDDITIGQITINAVTQQAQFAASTDYAVKLTSGARFNVGRIVVTNYDRAVVIDTTTDSTVGGCDVTSYVRGVWETTNTNLYLGKSDTRTRSPNAANVAGNNGLLSSYGTNNTIENFCSEDAGEEGIRLGAGPHKNFTLAYPRVKRAQANGIKVLGTNNTLPLSTEYQQNVVIVNPIVEDCGTGVSGDDVCGIMISRTVGCQVLNPIIRTSQLLATAGTFITGNRYQIVSPGTTDFTLVGAANSLAGTLFTATGPGTGTGTVQGISCVNGILVFASSDVNITDPIVKDFQTDGIVYTNSLGASNAASANTTVAGSVYQIASVGTTSFTTIGASANTVGTVFTANGVGTGTGTVYLLTVGDCSAINTSGGMVSNGGSRGFRATATYGGTIRNSSIKNTKLFGNVQGAAIINGSTVNYTSSFVNCYISAELLSNSTKSMTCNSAAWQMDFTGNEAIGSAPVAFADIAGGLSSRWSNGTNFYVLKGSTVSAGSFTVGRTYQILTVGSTDYTTIGAPANTVGLVFTATGVGAGTGTATLMTWTAL